MPLDPKKKKEIGVPDCYRHPQFIEKVHATDVWVILGDM